MGERVYHYARSGDPVAMIEAAIREAESAAMLLGMVVESSSLDLRQDLSDDNLRDLVSKAVALISDAFDGESYVIAELVDGESIVPQAG